jgi:predicted small lipoprotein YifL
MRPRFLALVSLAALALLAACGPMYQTDYQVVPPQTETGRMCANNCLLSKSNCRNNCRMQSMQCQEIERLRARSDYYSYLDNQRRSGRPAQKTEGDFYRSYACDEGSCAEQCEGDYRICHVNCGGQMIPHTYCTAFCD